MATPSPPVGMAATLLSLVPFSIPAALLVAPVPAQQLVFPPATSRVEIPMRQLRNGSSGGVPVVNARLGTRKVTMIVDTGAGLSLLSSGLVEELGLEGRGRVRMLGAGDGVFSQIYHLPRVQIGELGVEGLKAIAHDLSGIARRLGAKVEGILGVSLLARHPVTFDFAAGRLVIEGREGFHPPPDAMRLKLEFNLGIPVIRAALDGRRPARFLLDTGNQGALILNAPYVRRHALIAEPDRYPGSSLSGVGGSVPVRLGRIGELTIGEHRLLDVPLAAAEKARTGLFADAVRAGNIGTGVLQRFRVTLDFAGKQAFLEPRRDLPARFRPSFGFTLRERRGRTAIAKVVPRSPAARAGLRRHDVLERIGGEPVKGTVDAIARRLDELEGVELELHRAGRPDPIRVRITRRVHLPRLPGPTPREKR